MRLIKLKVSFIRFDLVVSILVIERLNLIYLEHGLSCFDVFGCAGVHECFTFVTGDI